jgi:hypothetical protein
LELKLKAVSSEFEELVLGNSHEKQFAEGAVGGKR